MSNLQNTVKEWINEQIEEGYTSCVDDLLQNGCQSGMVSELIYYSDTVAFFRRHKKEINELLSDCLDGCGCTVDELFGHKWDGSDPLAEDTQNQNLLAWFAFEETAQRVAHTINP